MYVGVFTHLAYIGSGLSWITLPLFVLLIHHLGKEFQYLFETLVFESMFVTGQAFLHSAAPGRRPGCGQGRSCSCQPTPGPVGGPRLAPPPFSPAPPL